VALAGLRLVTGVAAEDAGPVVQEAGVGEPGAPAAEVGTQEEQVVE